MFFIQTTISSCFNFSISCETIQVCLTGSDEAEVATEFEELAKAFAERARASSPTLPLTVLVVQVITFPHFLFNKI